MKPSTRRAICQVGSQERRHFWHYCQGYLFGLVSAYQPGHRFELEDCGHNMNRLALDLLPGARVSGDSGATRFVADSFPVSRFDRPNQEGRNLSPGLVAAFREKFWELAAGEPFHPPPADRKGILIIERAHFRRPSDLSGTHFPTEGAQRRTLANLEDILALAENFSGVDCVKLEDVPLPEQARLFAAAGVIILQHGAAFFNTIFSPGAHVLEITNTKYFEPYATPYGITRHPIEYGGRFESAVANLDQLERCLQNTFNP